jgi:hypothetical protein
MRTTLTIDDDVAFGLRKAHEKDPKKSFKDVVNEVLRKGLGASDRVAVPKRPFKVEPLNLGLREDLNFDNIEELLDQLEGPFRK